MRNQQATTVDRICEASLAYVDAGDHVPNEPQVHFDNGDSRIAPAADHRQGEVGLGFFAEVHLTDVASPGLGCEQLRVLAQVDAAPEPVHGQSRYGNLLAALGVDVNYLGDRLGVAQEAMKIKASLVEGDGTRRNSRHPA